jgi:hypothetical protein
MTNEWTLIPRTVDITRLNIPSVKVTDGSNGARGGSFFKMSKSQLFGLAAGS